MAEKRVQPDWRAPEGPSKGLKVNNSLKLDELVDLVPEEGNELKWYTCGPTVYDSSHLGHARGGRTYLTFDIIRRIVEDYFHYDVFYCMNITDIDDKIIIRSRRNFLFDEYVKAHASMTDQVRADLTAAWTTEIAELEKKTNRARQDLNEGKRNAVEMKAALSLLEEKLRKAQEGFAAMKAVPDKSDATASLNACADALAAQIDAQKGGALDSEFIKNLCNEHAKKFEREFFADMKALGIKSPDVVVRVSEYVPQVQAMVQKIIDNGFGYVSEGSVYFDSAKFHNADEHVYGKLAPWSIGNLELIAEGEGALMASGVRRSDKDFALWKASKPGEPSWPSAWGPGRPGWHIECSAMACEVLGTVLDVHCGGADLKFPHHDNELAQSEAAYGVKQWVNYFLHAGHLDIDGLKMSKSLKNFITIRQALKEHSPRQLRLLFLLQAWDSKMNYQVKDTMLEADAKDKTISEFLLKVRATLQSREDNVNLSENWTDRDKALHDALTAAKRVVHEALSKNFDTSTALNALIELITKSNSYMVGYAERKALLLSKVASYVTRILQVFGLDYAAVGGTSSASGTSAEQREEVARPIVAELAKFRKNVREGAKEKKDPSYFLALCDQLRDESMPPLGVKIVDDADFSFFFVDADELVAEIAKKKAEALENAKLKRKKGLQNKLTTLSKEIEKWSKYSATPAEVVKAKYNVDIADPTDLPLADLSGKELSGGAKKQIPKLWNQQKDSYAKYEAELAKDPNFLKSLMEQRESFQKQLDEDS